MVSLYCLQLCGCSPTCFHIMCFLRLRKGGTGNICVPSHQYVSSCVSATYVCSCVQVLSHWSNFNMYKASRQCAPSCEFAMHQRKCNCNVCSCVAFLLYASSSCAFLEYLITCFLMLRYACIADNGLEFPQCVSKCAFSH